MTKAGLNPPAITEGYNWPGKYTPWDHQQHTAAHLASHKRSWCTNGMRSGKTTSAGLGANLLKDMREITKDEKILVLCPVNVMVTAWYRELKSMDRKARYYVGKGTTAQVEKNLPNTDLLIINHDKLPWLAEPINDWLGENGLIIVDEAHAFRTGKTDRHKCLQYLAHFDHPETMNRRLWLLTGTPVPNSPEDIYYLQKLIDPNTVPERVSEWRAKTMTSHDILVPTKPGSSRTRSITKWTALASAEQTVADAMQPCIRYRTQDCVDMPDQAYSYYECELDKDQKRMIKDLLATYAALHEDKAVIAANSGVRTTKLLQICTGTVLDGEGNAIVVGAKSKMKCLLELIEQTDGKVIVFTIYKASQDWIKSELKKKKITAEIVNGDTTQARRLKIVDAFQARRTPEVIIMHPQCEGMTLTRANTTVWWGPPESNLQWTQANERQRGPDGNKTLVAMIYGSKLELNRYRERISNDERQTRTLDIYAEALREFGTPAQLEAFLADDEDS